MNDEDFLEAVNIKFTHFDGKKEKILREYSNFEDLPKHLHDELISGTNQITFNGKKWHVVDIDKEFASHGNGIEMRIRLGTISFNEKH